MQVLSGGDSTRFGPYEIRGLLGRGGMGQVYRAWDRRLQREVALKVLHERSELDPARVGRFVAEARAASALNHPHILTVFDADVDGHTPYIVSELVDGESLRDELRRGPVPLKRLLDLATQMADGLADAHAAGIVHRDLKPENIMIARGGRVKILDFGLARHTGMVTDARIPAGEDGDTLTEVGLLAGTVPYMSPEQARGAPTDFRTDQFSLGLILYEMATGAPAFRRETSAATLDAIIADEPRPIRGVENSQALMILWWIVERCLAKDASERYGVTADLHRDLRGLRDRLPDLTARDITRPRAGRSRRSLAIWTTIAVLALAVAAAGAMLVRLAGDLPPADLTSMRFRALTSDAAYEGLPSLSPDGQVVAYSAEVDGILQIFTRRLSASAPAPVTRCVYDCTNPFWSPDGKRIYYSSLARQRPGIWSIGVAGGTPQVVIENATRAALSPDGRTLAFLRDEDRAEVVGTAGLWLSTPAGTAPWSSDAVERAARRYDAFGANRFIDGVLAFSPDGTRLGLCAVPGIQDERMWQFWIVPLTGDPPYRRFEWWWDAGPKISSFAWLPDGRHVVLGVTLLSTPGSDLWIADVQRDRAWPLTRGAGSELYPSVAPGGDRIVFALGEPDYDLLRIPLDGGPPVPLPATSHNEADPVLSPDGTTLAFVTDSTGQDEIWTRPADGKGGAQPLITQREFVSDRTVMLSSPAFSPDGTRIAYQRNGFRPRTPLRIWISLVAGGAPAPLLHESHQGLQSGPTWSPDGHWIAFAQWRDRRWELAKVRVGSAEAPVILRADGIANATPHWSPNDDWITWETEAGFILVSPDGTRARPLSNEQWLVHTWSRDGMYVIGIKETEDLRLSLVKRHVVTRVETRIADLGPSFAFNNPVRGLTLVDGGRSALISIVRPRGDLWLAEGLQWHSRTGRALSLLSGPSPMEIP